MTSRRTWDQPPAASLQDERAEGGTQGGNLAGVSWKEFLRDSTSWKTSATDGTAEERREERRMEETEKSQTSARPETPWGTKRQRGSGRQSRAGADWGWSQDRSLQGQEAWEEAIGQAFRALVKRR